MVKLRAGSGQRLIITDLGREVMPGGLLVLSHEAAQSSHGVKSFLGSGALTVEYAEKPLVLGSEYVRPETRLGPFLITEEGLRLAKEEGVEGVVPGYPGLNAKDAVAAVRGLGEEAELLALKEYEAATRNRVSVLKAIEECLSKLAA